MITKCRNMFTHVVWYDFCSWQSTNFPQEGNFLFFFLQIFSVECSYVRLIPTEIDAGGKWSLHHWQHICSLLWMLIFMLNMLDHWISVKLLWAGLYRQCFCILSPAVSRMSRDSFTKKSQTVGMTLVNTRPEFFAVWFVHFNGINYE